MFTKEMLDVCDIVELRNGQKFMIQQILGKKILINKTTAISLMEYDNNLTYCLESQKHLDIIKVFRPDLTYQLYEENWNDIDNCIMKRELFSKGDVVQLKQKYKNINTNDYFIINEIIDEDRCSIIGRNDAVSLIIEPVYNDNLILILKHK